MAKPEPKPVPEPNDYKFAFYSQTAVNVSGLVHTFAQVMEKIWEEARQLGKGTDYVNQHPITRLYAEQIHYLASGREYGEAYKICKEKGGVD